MRTVIRTEKRASVREKKVQCRACVFCRKERRGFNDRVMCAKMWILMCAHKLYDKNDDTYDLHYKLHTFIYIYPTRPFTVKA